VRALVCAGAGFLLAVLWMDLMFDVQVLRREAGENTAEAVGSIAAYYRRVTTKARPMNRLVATVMVGTIAAIVVEVARGSQPAWAGWTSLGLAVAAVALAALRTVGNAVRLGAQVDDPARQRALAQSIGYDHIFCLVAIGSLLVLQLAWRI
jgi:hypothetical protein